MAPEQANSPARRIYFGLQTAYIGDDTEREAGLDAALGYIEDFQSTTRVEVVRLLLEHAAIAAEDGGCYAALKIAKRIIQYEDAVLGKSVAFKVG